MATFQSKRDFEVWLAQQPQEVSAAIAARGALRVWPLVLGHRFWKASEEARQAQDTLTLLTGWAMMVAGVAATAPDPKVQEAAEAAYDGVATAAVASVTTAGADAVAYAADTADSAACAATRPTNAATFAAANAADAVDSAARAAAAVTVPSASKFAAAAVTAAAFRDCEFSPEKMLRQPLWHDIGPPVGLLPEDIGETLFDTNPRFGFFKRWYDGMNGGVPVPVDLCSRIVTQIPRETWQSGAEVVAAEIARIEAAWLAEQLPQADVLEFDAQKAAFVSRPIPLEAEKLVETTLRQVAFAVQVATTSNCGVNASSTACLYIDFTLEHCRDDPNAIEQNLEIARNDLDRGVADGSYQADGKLTALVEVLDRAVTDLRAHHPKVAEAWEARIRHKLKLAGADQRQLIVEKATELIAISSEKLGREMELDAKTIAGSSGEVQAGAIRRFFGRVAQMRIVVRSDEVIKRIDASSGYKGTRIVQTLHSLIDFVAGLF